MAPSSNPRGEVEMGISYLFFALATFALSMRLISRLIILKNGGLDEVAILVSYISSILLLVFTSRQVRSGEGKHFDDVTLEEFQMELKNLWISIAFYNLSLYLTKTSILLQYLRIFTNRIRKVCWCTLGAITLWGLYTILSMIFACIPVSAFWTGDPHARCVLRQFLYFFHSSVNIVTDLVILTLPMPILNSLTLPPRQKIALILIFGLGGLVCLASVLRLHSLYIISVSKDPTWDNVPTSIWSNIEVYLAIICASLPTIRPILEKLFPRALTRSRSGGASLPTNTCYYHRDNTITGASIRLNEVDDKIKTVTKVQAVHRPDSWLRDSSDEDLGKEIFVMTSMRRDVESRGKMTSDEDLIFQRP